MATMSLSQRSTNFRSPNHHSTVVEEIGGLIRVHNDGHVERPLVVPHVSCMVPLELEVAARDVTIDQFNTNLWARVYSPINRRFSSKLPLMVYFHGGGFCVGSASWACYHEFLTNLTRVTSCVVVSVNYRLAPENRLPAAYDDGINAILWLKQEALKGTINELKWCDFSNLFLAGDSAGANIAYHVASRLVSRHVSTPKGMILIQPFFGGETRSMSEKKSSQPSNSALTLSASDTYWRLALPVGAMRDHPWCNPLARGAPRLSDLKALKTMVCAGELDILKDRNLELAASLAGSGSRVQSMVYKDVGHAFQVLKNYPMAQTRTHEMMIHIKAFINQ
ncbi:probable carboxylesterase 17 [Cynara cardunculus var. scolymus]|uniref:Alpha/beta hydrolase fold-3 n=1 Tax=Cynara cardunculus var. scolymus TaxID=59895 RepID=A0A103YGW3_CYNCS|nr:probable carboxylesterase 17 [Cynara cardunculus var. scolymus]KVI08874.1 Alpha/beta hydrolase fold-3 [Cynara cardunculus var. scolymus]